MEGTTVPVTEAGRERHAIPSSRRKVRRDGRPTISVVVVSSGGTDRLEAHLAVLVEESEPLNAQLVVVRADGDAGLPGALRRFPDVRWVQAEADTGPRELRSRGMAEADGDIVVIVDDAEPVAAGRLGHLQSLREPAGGHPGNETPEETAAQAAWQDEWSDAYENGHIDVAEPGRTVDRLGPGDHVVIIGAGPGGLTPAYILAKRGVRVTVVEADDIVGGISRTARYKGYRFDIGGHRFFTKIRPVQEFWQEILGDQFISTPRLSRIHYDGKFFDYPLKAGNALRGLGAWKAVQIVASYLRAHVRPSPVEENLEQWVTNRFGRRLYEIFFKTYTEKVWGIPCTEIRAEWAAQRIQNLSLAKAILSATSVNRRSTNIKTLIHEFQYPRLGPGQMWEMCAAKVEALGGRILMRHEATRLELESGRIRAIRCRTPDGDVRIAGDHFISTMPVRELVRAIDDVPVEIRDNGEGLKYRDFILVALILDQEDVFPDNWIYIHTPGVKVGRIQNFNNWSRDMVPEAGRTCLGMEYFCFEGDGLWTARDEDLVALAEEELSRLGLAGTAKVVDGTVVRMQKAYPVYDSVYREHLDGVRSFVDPITNLHPVGRNGMHKYNNQDHSMLTAMFAVENMDGASHDVWAVNTDFEYHEEQRLAQEESAAAPAGG